MWTTYGHIHLNTNLQDVTEGEDDILCTLQEN